jgi:hypothetical protein
MKKHRQNIAMVVLGCLFSFNLDGPPQAPGARAKVTGGTLVAVKDDRPDIPYKRLNTLVASPVRIVLMEKISQMIFVQPGSHPAYGTSTGNLST